MYKHYDPGVDSASNRNEYQESFGGKVQTVGQRVRLTTHRHLWADFLENVGASTACYRDSFTIFIF
jgi:hypothetical protein